MNIFVLFNTRLRTPRSISQNMCFIFKVTRRRISTRTLKRDNQTFCLPDGRILGFAEYGCQSGFPLMFFHGFPSSRLEGQPLEKIGHSRKLRIIAPDRPGFGLSSPQPGRCFMDWPADIQALARHLNIPRFAILGGSGGGPYAIACAHSLPREMLSAVGVLAGAGPWESGTQGVLLSARATAFAARVWPAGLRGLVDAVIGLSRAAVTTGLVIRIIDKWLAKIEGENQRISNPEAIRESLLRAAFESFAQGSRAMVQEAQLLTSLDWGFKFEDVSFDSIRLYHGIEDKNAPIRMTRYVNERLPHSVLREFAGDTHFTLGRHLDDIINDLLVDDMS